MRNRALSVIGSMAMLALTVLPARAGMVHVSGDLVAAGYEYGFCCDRIAAIFWIEEDGGVHGRVSACYWAWLGELVDGEVPDVPCAEWDGLLDGGSMRNVDTPGPIDDVAVTGTLAGVGWIDLLFTTRLPYRGGDSPSRGVCATDSGVGTSRPLVWHAAHSISGEFVAGAEMQGRVGDWYLADVEPTEWGCADWGSNASATWVAR
jgi:hypothetical protein